MERFSTIDVLANDADHYYRMQVAVTAAPAVRAKHASAVPLFRCSAVPRNYSNSRARASPACARQGEDPAAERETPPTYP
jgi:hypothetical protein